MQHISLETEHWEYRSQQIQDMRKNDVDDTGIHESPEVFYEGRDRIGRIHDLKLVPSLSATPIALCVFKALEPT